MDKILVYEDKETEREINAIVEEGCRLVNGIIDRYRGVIIVANLDDIKTLFDSPAKYAVKMLGLKGDSIVRQFADARLLEMLEDGKPLSMVNEIEELKGVHVKYNAVRHAIDLGKVADGLLRKDCEKIKQYAGAHNIYAETAKEKEVAGAIGIILEKIGSIDALVASERIDQFNTKLPFAEWSADKRGFVINPGWFRVHLRG